MDFVFIIAIFEALTLAFLVYYKKKPNASDKILAIFFLVFGINILLSYIETYDRNNDYPFPAFINTTAPFFLLHGSVLWLYIKSQTKQKFKIILGSLFILLMVACSPTNKLSNAESEKWKPQYRL